MSGDGLIRICSKKRTAGTQEGEHSLQVLADTPGFRGQRAGTPSHLRRGRNRGSNVVELSALCTKISRISMALKGEKNGGEGGRKGGGTIR
jgi:hypothetical protein